MNDFLIIGASGFAREAAWLIDEINKLQSKWNLLGFVAEDAGDVGKHNGKYKIVMADDELHSIDHEIHIAIGIGNPKAIANISKRFSANPNIKFPNLIHPSVIGDFERISMGMGNIICAGNIFTTDIKIGSHNIFNLSCTIGHESAYGDCNVINPGTNLSGWIDMGDRNMLGTGVKILERLSIGSDVLIGAGSVLTKPAAAAGTYVGVPAKKIK
jgi:sugar O-acyltransferase (sialic acid O-acetyltransferase NeuD family)